MGVALRAHGASSSPFHAAWVMPLVSIASLTAVAGPGSAAADSCRNETNLCPRPSAGVATHWRRMRSARMIAYLHGGSVFGAAANTQQGTAVGTDRRPPARPPAPMSVWDLSVVGQASAAPVQSCVVSRSTACLECCEGGTLWQAPQTPLTCVAATCAGARLQRVERGAHALPTLLWGVRGAAVRRA